MIMRIAMWSGPRNISTAMMYSFAARGDAFVWDEPFYAAYLAQTGLPHPMRDQVLAAGEVDADKVAARCAGPTPGNQPVFYQKHMCQHMVPGVPRDWMAACFNVFLIRHPARVIASFARKYPSLTLDDIGFAQQAGLYDDAARAAETPPLVLDSEAIRANPKAQLSALCAALGIPFSETMLSWPKGGHENDGVWAPVWYGAVHDSTGFAGAEGPLPQLSPELAELCEQAMPAYRHLKANVTF